MTVNLNKNKPAPAQLGFIGAITFLGSVTYESRVTKVMDFGTMVDWMRSCHDYFTQMVMAGDFDGDEIFVDIHEFLGDDPLEFDFDFASVIDQFVIDNV